MGADLAAQLRDASLRIYAEAAAYARERGILIADTKFEFGHRDGQLILIDELLTPDKFTFWDAAHYAPGGPQASLDKQYVRDWLLASGWNREPPPPPLPAPVIARTAAIIREAYARLTGESWAEGRLAAQQPHGAHPRSPLAGRRPAAGRLCRRLLLAGALSSIDQLSQQSGYTNGNLSDLYSRWYGSRKVLQHGRDPYSAAMTAEMQIGFYGRAALPGENCTKRRSTRSRSTRRFSAPLTLLDFGLVKTWATWLFPLLIAIGMLLGRPSCSAACRRPSG